MRPKRNKTGTDNSKRNIQYGIVIAIIFMLCASLLAEIFIPNYQANALFLTIVGTVLGIFLKDFKSK